MIYQTKNYAIMKTIAKLYFEVTMKPTLSRYKAYSMLLICGVAWAASTIVIKVSLNLIDPFHLMLGRFSVAFLVLFLVNPSTFFKSTIKDALMSMGLGVWIFGAYALAIFSLSYTTASKSGFLVAMAVILVPLIQLLFHKKRPTLWVAVSVMLSLVGLYLISGMDGIGFNLGDFLAILSSLSYAIYIILVDRYAKEIRTFTLVQFQLLTMILISFCFVILYEGLMVHMLVQGTTPILLTGLIGTALTLFFQVDAQRVASPESVGLLLLSEPVFTFVMAWGLLHETITPSGTIGGGLIIGAMVLTILKKI